MSCNGCRVLRKGCSETCILRPCLQWIDTAEAQGHATVFVAKFFGRAGLMSFISAVPETQRPALFKSLLYESCGRTVNPVNGAVGLLWAGNWHLCQAAVETVLRGGTLRPIPELLTGAPPREVLDEVSEGEVVTCNISRRSWNKDDDSNNSTPKRKRVSVQLRPSELDLSLAAISPAKLPADKRRLGSPSMNSEESVATSGFDYATGCGAGSVEPRLLNLFC